MGTPIWTDPPNILLDPTFGFAEGDPQSPWQFFDRWDWDNGFIECFQNGIGQRGMIRQPTPAAQVGDPYTVKIRITENVGPGGITNGVRIHWGTFHSDDMFGIGIYAFSFTAGGNLDHLYIEPPSFAAPYSYCRIDWMYCYEERFVDYFWIYNSWGLNYRTFYEFTDFGGGELMYRFANRRDATNILMKIEP